MGTGDDDWRKEVAEAMERAAEGDKAAFVLVCRLFQPRLHPFAKRKMRSEADVQDLLQEVWLTLHLHRSTYRKGADPVPWVFCITHRKIIDWRRRAGRRGEEFVAELDAPSYEELPDSVAIRREMMKQFYEVFATLPEETREAWQMVRVHGMSIADVAEMFGTSDGAIKQRLHRADVAIRSVLGQDGCKGGGDDEPN